MACLSKELFQNLHFNCFNRNIKRPSITGAITRAVYSCAHHETRRFLARSVPKHPPSCQRENGTLSNDGCGLAYRSIYIQSMHELNVFFSAHLVQPCNFCMGGNWSCIAD